MIDRPKEQKPFDEDDDELGDAFADEGPTSPGKVRSATETPTIAPPFDFDAFAKASDSRIRTARTPSPESSAMTAPPPRPLDSLLDFDLVEDLGEETTESSFPRPMRPPQVTLTDEDELESARLRSVLMPSEPPATEDDALSMVDERTTALVPARGPSAPGFEEKDPFASRASAGPSAGDDMPTQVPAAGDALGEMRDRFALGDCTGALQIAETLLAMHPGHREANDCADQCRETLLQMVTARIGPLERVPFVVVAREQLRWLSIDHRAGFLLSHVDGVSSLEMILDVSGMPALDALRILYELAQQRVISFRG